MTLTELQAMPNEEMDAKVAEVLGRCSHPYETRRTESVRTGETESRARWICGVCGEQPSLIPLPTYTRDLNACAEFEATLTEDEHELFRKSLRVIAARDARVPVNSDASRRAYISATARQRCIAFLMTEGGAQ